MHRMSIVLLATALCACDGMGAAPPVETLQPSSALHSNSVSSRYEITRLEATLGGHFSIPYGIDNRGRTAGFSDLPGDTLRRAVLWRAGVIVDLGTLGGPNSNVTWPGQNDNGMIVGISEMAALDTLEQRWSCSAFFPRVTHHICRGFVWENGAMTPLETLGGAHSYAAGVNNRRQVVGWAETSIHDPTCVAPQVRQFRAVLWEPRRGRARELPPLPGDSTSAATAINEGGQVVGISGDCDNAVGRWSARSAVIWENGRVTDIGHLGGEAWHTPTAINDRGEVVGFSNPPGIVGGAFQPLAFIWNRRDGIDSLPLLDGHVWAQAFGINGRGQVVGRSCGAGGCRAVLWEHGAVTDLNDVAELAAGDVLVAARHINNAGTITGNLVDGATGRNLGYIAEPAPARRQHGSHRAEETN